MQKFRSIQSKKVSRCCSAMHLLLYNPAADPGFPRRGTNPWGGINLLFGIFAKNWNCMNIKKMAKEGTCAPRFATATLLGHVPCPTEKSWIRHPKNHEIFTAKDFRQKAPTSWEAQIYILPNFPKKIRGDEGPCPPPPDPVKNKS